MRRTLGAIALSLVLSYPLAAQDNPSGQWRTLITQHFHLHYKPALEATARRAAVNAERAWTAHARELVPPREPIDIVLSDNVDYANGLTTPFPTNHILLYAHPPTDVQSLRFYGDWNTLLIEHELTHVFHLDRARGWWAVGQHILGRNALLMPNLYTPAWLYEGLAVYYESRLTGFGRVAGTAHRTIAAAAASDNDLPRLDQLSLSSPEWPNGNGAYAFGSLLFQYLSDTRGPETIPKFVEILSAQPIPFFLNSAAKKAFGISFEAAWRQFRDSLMQVARAQPREQPLPLTNLTREGNSAFYPRWINDTTLVYTADNQRDLPGLYAVTTSGHEHRLDRRNGTDLTAPASGDDLLFSQLDYTSPYDILEDLYRTHNGHTERLTHGARLSYPDGRADGTIVAVQATPGTTRLVLVRSPLTSLAPLSQGRGGSGFLVQKAPGAPPLDPGTTTAVEPRSRGRDTYTIEALTSISPDTEWDEPRWSPDGHAIAAVRWVHGGFTEIVVLDTTGRVTQVVTHTQAVESSPAWTPDGRRIVFTSDRTGRTEVYVATLATSDSSGRHSAIVAKLGGAGSAVLHPAPSPDGRTLAVAAYRGNGYHIAITPFNPDSAVPVRTDSVAPPIPVAPVASDSSPAHGFNPWRGLIPRYWTPVTGTSDQGYFEIGAFTSAADAVGRNAYQLDALYNPQQPSEPDLSFLYAYSGIGQPVLTAGAAMTWTHERVANDSGSTIGLLVHRSITLSLAETLLWPRARTNTSWSIGTNFEFRDYHTTPGSVIELLSPVFASHPFYPSLFTTVSWSNAQYPERAISAENGVTLTATGQEQWQPGQTGGGAIGGASPSVVGVADLYQALDLPGFAHHVIALQLAGGWEGTNSSSTFAAGGTPGQALGLLPGVAVGNQALAFGVRGYGSGSARGTVAWASSLEYRLPLGMPGRGIHLLPLFLGRVSLAVFGDAAEAWCPGTGGGLPPACSAQDAERRLMQSVGSELDLDTGLEYDVPFRFRLGFAIPTVNRAFYGNAAVSPYIAFGISF